MSQSDSPPEPPQRWVEALQSAREEVVELLQELKELHLRNEYSAARERINDFYDHDPDKYRAVLYTLGGSEQFFEDIEEQMSEAAVEDLEELADRYSGLWREFQAAFSEKENGKECIVTGGRLKRDYDPTDQSMLIRLTLESGDMDVLETKNSAGRIVYLADIILEAGIQGIETAVTEDLSIADNEVALIRRQAEEVSENAQQLADLVEELAPEEEAEEDANDG